MISHVDKTDPDGSFDQMVTARVLSFTLTICGDNSGKVLDVVQDPTLDLSVPTADIAGSSSKATFC